MVSLKVGEPQVFQNLTLFPLLRYGHLDAGIPGEGGSGDWMLLPDALDAGTLEVREVHESGIVGELVAINRGSSPVLILDGEQLIGAKQNRTTARTILLGAGSETRIPVSCMEQGRWRNVSRAMRHSREHSPSKLRRHARRVEADEARRAAARPDAEEHTADRGRPRRRSRRSAPSELLSLAQSEVWDTVAESQRRSGVHSRTGALDEVYADRKAGLDAWQIRLPAVPDQVGLLAFVDGVPAGLDVLADPGIYARVHDRLVRAYAFEAMDAALDAAGGEDRPVADAAAGEAFLTATANAARHPMETAGMGKYSAVVGDVVGGELVWEDEVVHLSAFAPA